MGAGVLLLEHHTAWHGATGQARSGLAVLLFRDRRSGRFTDAGGSTDQGETGEQTASRELFEESAGLFNIDLASPNIAKQRVVLSSGYTAYVVGVRVPLGCVSRRLFLQNTGQIDAHSQALPTTLQETDDMRHVFVQDIVASGALSCNSRKASAIPIPDTTGAPLLLTKRAVCVLQKAYAGGALSTRRMCWNPVALGWSASPLPGVALRSYGTVPGQRIPPRRRALSRSPVLWTSCKAF